jgi:hypothetical protein
MRARKTVKSNVPSSLCQRVENFTGGIVRPEVERVAVSGRSFAEARDFHLFFAPKGFRDLCIYRLTSPETELP